MADASTRSHGATITDPYDHLHGYYLGPTVERPPWPLMWEQGTEADGCNHSWECVLLEPMDWGQFEEVVRCVWCHTPRCGESRCEPPCMKRRHHRGDHVYLDGSRAPLGGSDV